MNILLSNDDGYRSPGINALATTLAQIASVTVVAPESNRSCASSSLSVRQHIRVEQTDSGVYVVDGTPGDCVHLAINGMLDVVPDMVVSGINEGANLGDDVIYSGTVAAAIEGRFLGLPAMAVSLVGEKLVHYQTAAEVVRNLIEHMADQPLPQDTILNINVPDIPYESIAGTQVTRCGARHQSQPIIALPGEDTARYFRIGPAGDQADSGPGTDFYAITHNQVSITPLQIDMTRYSRLADITQWVTELPK